MQGNAVPPSAGPGSSCPVHQGRAPGWGRLQLHRLGCPATPLAQGGPTAQSPWLRPQSPLPPCTPQVSASRACRTAWSLLPAPPGSRRWRRSPWGLCAVPGPSPWPSVRDVTGCPPGGRPLHPPPSALASPSTVTAQCRSPAPRRCSAPERPASPAPPGARRGPLATPPLPLCPLSPLAGPWSGVDPMAEWAGCPS